MRYDIGIIGAGQLAMMIAEDAKSRGLSTIALDEYNTAPAFTVTDEAIVGKFSDVEKLEELCKKSAIVVYEFENINLEAVETLAGKYNIYQGSAPLKFSKHRIVEKTFAKENGLNPPKFALVNSKETLETAISEIGFPCVLKTTTLGYDGKGQAVLKSETDVQNLPEDMLKESICEQFVKFDYEVSAIVCRNKLGEMACLPISENRHKRGILDVCIVPPTCMSEKMQDKVKNMAKSFMEKANFYGILAIEFFILGEDVYFNEMAPRPHNSGHHSIETCSKSQYGLLIDCVMGDKLEDPTLICNGVMKNILGEDVVSLENYPENEKANLHWYHKSPAKVGRKMAHITFTDMTADEFEKIDKKYFEDKA